MPQLIISDERDALLETGGGVVKALPLLGEEPVFICNIDAVWLENTPTLDAMIAAWHPVHMDDLLLLARRAETLGYPGAGDFHLSGDGRLTRRTDGTAPYVYAGVQIAKLGPMRSFEAVPFSRNKVWDVSLAKGRAFGHVLDGFWMHVGDPDARMAAEEKLKHE